MKREREREGVREREGERGPERKCSFSKVPKQGFELWLAIHV